MPLLSESVNATARPKKSHSGTTSMMASGDLTAINQAAICPAIFKDSILDLYAGFCWITGLFYVIYGARPQKNEEALTTPGGRGGKEYGKPGAGSVLQNLVAGVGNGPPRSRGAGRTTTLTVFSYRRGVDGGSYVEIRRRCAADAQ
jgi:hypothetical protein